MFKTFGGSRELTVEHRELALQIFRAYKENLQIYINILEPYIEDSPKFFGRNKKIGFDKFIQQYNEDIDEVIYDLENDLIYYYVANTENVGAAAYGGTATIKEEAFDDLIIFLNIRASEEGFNNIDLSQVLENNMWGHQVKRIFYDLIHEVDHTITPEGHAPEFSASNKNFSPMHNLDRPGLLDHIFDGKDPTYHVERGFIHDVINLWHTTVSFREARSQSGCMGKLVEIFSDRVFSHAVGFDWYGLLPQYFESVSNEICQVRGIPRDADEANFCSRTQEIQDALLGEWTCAEIRIADCEKKSYVVLSGKGIQEYQQGDFLYFSNALNFVMSGNDVSILPANGFSGLDSIEYMTLSNNPITTIVPGAFNGLSQLKSLYATNMEISELPIGIFTPLVSLLELKLSSPNLTAIQSGSLSGLHELETLDIRYSQLSEIQPLALSHLGKVKQILFRHNRLTELPNYWWSGINPMIQMIDLRNNRFSDEVKQEIQQAVEENFPYAQLLL